MLPISEAEIVSLPPEEVAKKQTEKASKPKGPLPFPKSELEIYLEKMKMGSSMSVTERILEAAKQVLKRPATKAYAPSSEFLDKRQ